VERLGRVLVIEEDDLLRWSLTHYLAEDGQEIRAVGSLNEVGQALAVPPDVIVFDLDLPRSTTLGWLRLLREGAPNALLIATTTESTEDGDKAVLAEGAVAVLRKPFDLSAVREIVRRHARGPAPAPARMPSES